MDTFFLSQLFNSLKARLYKQKLNIWNLKDLFFPVITTLFKYQHIGLEVLSSLPQLYNIVGFVFNYARFVNLTWTVVKCAWYNLMWYRLDNWRKL